MLYQRDVYQGKVFNMDFCFSKVVVYSKDVLLVNLQKIYCIFFCFLG